MPIEAVWKFPETPPAVSDVARAITEVAARHPGVAVLRDGAASFRIGLPASMLGGDDESRAGVFWGAIRLSKETAGAGVDLTASPDSSAPAAHGAALSAALSDFTGQVVAELGITPSPSEPPPEVAKLLSWDEVLEWVREQNFEVVDEGPTHVSVVMRWEDDNRSQLVSIDSVKRFQSPWLKITTGICKLDGLMPERALELNEGLVASLACDDVEYYLVYHHPIAFLTMAALESLLWDIASEADLLEQEVTGGRDEY